jgi:hypothetical protein
LEGDVEAKGLGTFSGKSNEIPGSVKAGDVSVSSTRQFNGMPSLTATKIEVAIVGLQTGHFYETVNILYGVLVVFNNITVGLQIERPE